MGKRNPLAGVVRRLIVDHHEAFLVELFGDTAPVPPERVQELLSNGTLDPALIGRVRVTVGEGQSLDAFAYLHHVSAALAGLSPDDQIRARDWGVEQWAPFVRREMAKAKAPARAPATAVLRVRPEPPEVDSPPAVAAESTLSPAEQAAHREALSRAGAYARGLGNVFAADAERHVAEVWDGEELVEQGDAVQRAGFLDTIREQTADALITHRDPEKLARDLGSATGYYTHNWRRIAQTELQGTHNLATCEVAIDRYGEDARIARVVESGACAHCKRLFQTADGAPQTFLVRELLENGTNVGVSAAQWAATAWPVHPNCRCGTMVIPPGYEVEDDGRLRKR